MVGGISVGEWWQGWPWLNENAWVASALMAIALAGGAATMGWHVWRTRGRRSNYLAIVGLLVLAAAFVLTGVSVGERPIVEGRVLIPTIRLLWLAAAVIFNGYLVGYWWRRVTLT